MRRTLSFLLLLVLFSLACAGTQSRRPANMPQPDIEAGLLNPIFFGSGTTAPATIEIRVANRGQAPLVVRRIELDSPGMGQYSLIRLVRHFNETIPPGEARSMTAFATAVAQTTRRPTEPLTIRAMIEMQSQGSTWREIALIRANP